MLIVQSATDASSVRPIVPPKFGSGIGSTVRSGLNFPIASASDSFNAPSALLVALDDRPHQRARERLLDTEPLLVVEDRDDPGRPRRQVLADLVVNLVVRPGGRRICRSPCPRPHRPRPTPSSGGANKPTASPTPPPQPIPLRPRLSPVCRTATLPSSACVTRITPSIETCLLLDERDERLEVARRLVDVLITGNEDVGRRVSHCLLFRAWDRPRCCRRALGRAYSNEARAAGKLQQRGVVLGFARLKGRQREIFAETGLTERIGAERFFPTVRAAVAAFEAQTDSG